MQDVEKLMLELSYTEEKIPLIAMEYGLFEELLLLVLGKLLGLLSLDALETL